MVDRRRPAGRSSGRRNASASNSGHGDVYQELLDAAGVVPPSPSTPERPLKRRRQVSGEGANEAEQSQRAKQEQTPRSDPIVDEEDDDLADIEFEDVPLPMPAMQTMERESDEEDDDEEDEIEFEDVDFAVPVRDSEPTSDQAKELELNLTAHQQANTPSKRGADRRRPITKEERDRRVDVHKMHLLCLICHVARRNRWCNDPTVQDYLRPHLTDKAVKYLTPGSYLNQFSQAESLKTGLQQAGVMWKTKFEIAERGMRRALWAEDPDHLKDYDLPDDAEVCLDRNDFKEAANKLQGSRDVGAQLYCALLRSIGVRARLVCSLQVLAFGSGSPTLPKPKPKEKQTPRKNAKADQDRTFVERYKDGSSSAISSPSAKPTARRRLGHPNAAAYDFESSASASRPRPAFEAPKRIKESSYPVYWVEVLDVGHQKWQPADPVVTRTFWKPKVLEPPITDRENSLSYVIAFDADGTARDVTRRYAKAYTAKTRKMRIESGAEDGERWWRKATKLYRSPFPDDLYQIEENELAGVEAREPMPRNVQDFKNHPIYALERQLRRHEVLVPGASPSGTVAAGNRGPLEKIYRRKDVRIARTEDKWYRLGRVVKPLEIPVKWLPKKARGKNPRYEDEEDEAMDDGLAGVPMYTEEQTDLYEPPRVRNGRVPRNKFGNIDVYVPSMVPLGGVHVVHEQAARAAFILGIDYAPALTGFQFKGRHGTAVLNGIVVAKENEEAVRAVISGLSDVERELEEERRSMAVLKMWRRFLMVLRIRERIWSGADEAEREEAERNVDLEIADAASDVTEEFDMVDDDDAGGGFMVE